MLSKCLLNGFCPLDTLTKSLILIATSITPQSVVPYPWNAYDLHVALASYLIPTIQELPSVPCCALIQAPASFLQSLGSLKSHWIVFGSYCVTHSWRQTTQVESRVIDRIPFVECKFLSRYGNQQASNSACHKLLPCSVRNNQHHIPHSPQVPSPIPIFLETCSLSVHLCYSLIP